MQGWIKLHREILDSDLWNDVTTYRLFSYLLLKASHKGGVKIQGLELERGQWVRSYRKLAQDLAYKEGRGLKEYSLKTITKCVNKLVKSGTVSIQETKQGTLFTIVNYARYQDESDIEKETVNGIGNEQETNGKRTVNKNKNAIKNAKNAQEKIPYVEIVNYLNEKTGQRFSSKAKSTKELINGRFQEGRTFEDFKHVIDVKSQQWLNNPEMSKYLRPSTLFAPKNFENYVNEKILRKNKADIANKEAEFQRWMMEGNDPDEFDWSK